MRADTGKLVQELGEGLCSAGSEGNLKGVAGREDGLE